MNQNTIIIGNGLSSLATSLAIAELGINVDLYIGNENQKKTNLVTFLSQNSLEFLKKIDSQQLNFKQYETIDEIECSHFDKKNNYESVIDFASKENEYLGKIIPNNDLYNLMLSKAYSVSNIKIHKDTITKIDKKNDNVILEINGNKEIKSDFVILADGKNFFIKKKLTKNMIYKKFNQTALSIRINASRKIHNKAYQYFTKDGPLALLPFLNNSSSLIWSLNKDSNILNLSKDDLKNKIEYIISDDCKSISIQSIEQFELSFQYAKKLFYSNCLLVGDIAHTIHPIAGQGMNLTIKDIISLRSIIKKYLNIGYKINSQLLAAEFYNLRSLDIKAYSFGTYALSQAFFSNNLIMNKSLGLSFKILNQIPFLKNKIIKSATGSDHLDS